MSQEKEIENVIRSFEKLAKTSRTEIELKLDGSPVAGAKLVQKDGGGLKAIVRIIDFKKALVSPALLKAALSLFALKGKLGASSPESKIEIELEGGMFSRLFGNSAKSEK